MKNVGIQPSSIALASALLPYLTMKLARRRFSIGSGIRSMMIGAVAGRVFCFFLPWPVWSGIWDAPFVPLAYTVAGITTASILTKALQRGSCFTLFLVGILFFPLATLFSSMVFNSLIVLAFRLEELPMSLVSALISGLIRGLQTTPAIFYVPEIALVSHTLGVITALAIRCAMAGKMKPSIGGENEIL